MTLLGIPQNLSHESVTQTPKSVVLRARKSVRRCTGLGKSVSTIQPTESRKMYRAVLSEPKLIIPPIQPPRPTQTEASGEDPMEQPAAQLETTVTRSALSSTLSSPVSELTPSGAPEHTPAPQQQQHQPQQLLAMQKGNKRQRDKDGFSGEQSQKKKKRKN